MILGKRGLLFLFFVGISFVSSQSFQDACIYIVNNDTSYNLLAFTYYNPKSVEIPGMPTYNLTFHFCNRQIVACGVPESKSGLLANKIFGKLTHKEDEKEVCQNVTTAADERSTIPHFLNASDPKQGVKLVFPDTMSGGDNITMVLELTCKQNASIADIEWGVEYKDAGENVKTIVLKGASKEGCIFISPAFFKKWRPLFTVIFITLGVLSMLFGQRFFRVTLFSLSTGMTTSVLFIFFSIALVVEPSSNFMWGLLGGSLILGLVVGYFVLKIEKLGFFVLGFYFGILGAFFLYSFLLHFFNVSAVTLYLFIIFMSLIGGALAVWFFEDITILFTSCIGSYLTIRGISLYIGGFPYEIDVVRGLEKFDYKAYAYLVLIMILATYGVVRQYKKQKADELDRDGYSQANDDA